MNRFLTGLTGVRAFSMIAALAFAPAALADVPRVAASIAPVHSLAAAVMAGVGEPDLLERDAPPPEGAYDLLFWVGPVLEPALDEALLFPPAGLRVEALSRAPGVEALPRRGGWVWGTRRASGDDPYYWLDPKNARIWAMRIASALTVADPENAGVYALNARRLSTALIAFDRSLAQRLETVRTAPFVTNLDRLQYLEDRYELSGAGSLVDTEDADAARKKIRSVGAVCLLSTDAEAAERIAEGTTLRTGVIDPFGAGTPPGPTHYLAMMRALSGTLMACLDG